MESVDLNAIAGRGPAWGTATTDLNATLLIWSAGEGQPQHVNNERDVILVVLSGSGTVSIDGEVSTARAGTLVVIPCDSIREVTAGVDGMRCLTVHNRRGGLTIRR
jgi:quercetin dioxygenase-like cupin family protein